MCNLSERMEEIAFKKGFELGIELGKAFEFINIVKRLQEVLSISLEEVLQILKTTMEDYINAQELLKKYNYLN